MEIRLGIDCGSISLNLALLRDAADEPLTVYRRTSGRPLSALIQSLDQLIDLCGHDVILDGVLATGSGRELLARSIRIPAVNEITAHSAGVFQVDPTVRTIIEIGGQDSKFIRLDAPAEHEFPRFSVFRMNEVCAAGTGAFLDEQAARLGIRIEEFGSVALRSTNPAPIAGRCAVFAKTDMIHRAQEGTPLPDILMGVAYALARNYIATLIRGDAVEPVVSLQGGVMSNLAVVKAFRDLLGLPDALITVPRHFTVLGAVGCALIAERTAEPERCTLTELKARALSAMAGPSARSPLKPLERPRLQALSKVVDSPPRGLVEQPLVMGLDVGSVSVKGVVIDAKGRILAEDYRLSRSRPLETLEAVIAALRSSSPAPALVAVTGSGRYLAGRLIDADLIVNEISAQARAAVSYDARTDTVVEIGGQDSKWIGLENGVVKDFEMNRVCAAGTGSFLLEQAEHLGLAIESQFSEAALASTAPADLGTRCTVFMESDLIHHQNNGASSEDLAAGVCISIVQNYLERVANNRTLGENVLFLGGVAAAPAVRAAFKHQTGRELRSPAFYKVSGAMGAALKLMDSLERDETYKREPRTIDFRSEDIPRNQFRCRGCPNECTVDKYRPAGRVVYHGGLCDRWEVEHGGEATASSINLFQLRNKLLDELLQPDSSADRTWGMIRSPQFYEWFPFWSAFCRTLGISVAVAGAADRKQFERGLRFLKVETCLPVKVLCGQLVDLVSAGVQTVFYPTILSEPPWGASDKPTVHCPYIQASSQFFRGVFPVEWKEPVIKHEFDPHSFEKEHLRLARNEGFSRAKARHAVEEGFEQLSHFQAKVRNAGEHFLSSLDADEPALVVLGKPYHTADRFLNMNLGSLFQRLGVPAAPSDLLAGAGDDKPAPVGWKYEAQMVSVARRVSSDKRLFPVMITFFGCGPDPFTVRHIREALGGKPLLVLEMDEHTSRAGAMTRLEAFLDSIRAGRMKSARKSALKLLQTRETQRIPTPDFKVVSQARTGTGYHRPEYLFIPYFADHSYGFAAAARSVGIDARVLPPPDEQSAKLGIAHLVGGECHPFALVLGDYLKLASSLPSHVAERSLFYFPGPEACRMAQYSVYVDKVRRELGYSVGVIAEIDEGLRAFGLSERNRQRILLRGWEGLNAFDVLLRLMLRIRPHAEDESLLDRVYDSARGKLFEAIIRNQVRQGMEEALHELWDVPTVPAPSRPVVAITGDYYTRVIPFANNDVFREVERLGGMLWSPPTLTDSLKLSTLRDMVWNLLSGQSRETAEAGLLYLFLVMSEFKAKGGTLARKALDAPLDLSGRSIWTSASRHAHTELPSGITAPIATALQYLELGADGLLNLMTLNCSYGTVVTAVLMRALKERFSAPMLTLIYDGLKKTNEKTRLEAFMEQVHNHFERRSA
ncbi:MAG: acyl-CoA dehydratase activase [Thermodesulfobacteriota bacterium]